MLDYLVYGMIYIGSVLMVYNIYCFVMYASYIRKSNIRKEDGSIVNIPIALLISFLIGYLPVAIFGKPELIMAGILFGGSVFVYIIYRVLNKITSMIMESEKLESELKAIEESNRVKNSFMASISHEMRTPMNVILGIDELALKNPDLPEETRSQLEKIRTSGKHLLGLINNTLDMHNIEIGKLVAKSEPFDLDEILEQIEVMICLRCEEKNQTYNIYRKEGLSGHYIGDKLMIEDVLLHILDNAIKYTPKNGKIDFTIEELNRKDDKCNLCFTIADNGIGMADDFIPKIFELFSQEDASFTNRYGGSGLGLSIAKNKVDLMGGDIKVESKRNVGSTFTVTLPLIVTEEKETENTQIDLKGRMVLIVEDIDDNAEIVADLLELEGITSERAENGKKAIEMILERPQNYYDAILMDLRMPVMDGLEATKKIRLLDRQDCKDIPIIALSANAQENDIDNSLKAGMEAHLVKPIDVDKLYQTLNELVKKENG